MKTLVLCNAESHISDFTVPMRPKEMEYADGSAVEPKYFLPLVRLSVKNETVLVPASLTRLLNVFDTEMLFANWGSTKKLVGGRCKRDMEGFMEGLRKGKSWALKSKFQ